MASKMDVGRSSRTPVKHFLLNALVGKVCGVLALDRGRVPAKANPFLCVDLCGGDGSETDSHQASPRIMWKHCKWLHVKGFDACLHVIEKDANTFSSLSENMQAVAGGDNHCVLNLGDARQYKLPKLKSDQAVFVHCDPNAVDQTPLTDPFVASFNDYTMYLVTLGCNVGGLKRLPLSQRELWFSYVNMLTAALPRNHDAILFWLNRDSAQWAYLLSIPECWSAKFQADMCKSTSKHWDRGVLAASYRRERVTFSDQINRLFLTAKEYSDEH